MTALHWQHWPPGVPKNIDIPATSVFHNLQTTAARFPSKAASVFYGSTLTWAQTLQQAQALAAWLQHKGGLQDGDRVALYLQNSPQYIVAFNGIVAANGVGVLVNVMLVQAEVEHIVKDSGARIAIVAQDLLARVLPLLESGLLQHIVVTAYSDALSSDAQSGPVEVPEFARAPLSSLTNSSCHAWRDVLAFSQAAWRAHNRQSNDLAVLPYTSGTTGKPKGCCISHRNLQYQCAAGVAWGQANSADMQLLVVPMFHITGFVLGVCANTFIGSTMVILPRWDREVAAALIKHYRVTHWTNIPTMVIDMLASPHLANYDWTSFKRIGGGGAAMPQAVAERLKALSGVDYIEGYGLSETCAPSHHNPVHRPKRQCLGIPFLNVDARVVDPDTLQDLAQGDSGEIILRGPGVMSGYWNDEEKTAQAFVELQGERYFRTGDLARIDEDGYYFLVDRLKRMINASGFKVWPAEVESTMYQHPGIAECCIIAARDDYRGETVKAIVVRKSGQPPVSEQEIIDWAREKMAAYKVPRRVEFAQSLPKSGAGKVLWRVLQEQEQNQQETAK
jgi:fatty-acyl-CoA synthase